MLNTMISFRHQRLLGEKESFVTCQDLHARKNWRFLELLKNFKDETLGNFWCCILMASPALPHIQYLIPPEIHRYNK